MKTRAKSNVIKMPSQASEKPFERRWGKQALKLGFTQLPNALIEGQRALGLSASDFNLIVQLLSYWWYTDREQSPFPSKATLAARTGLTARSVQRRIRALEDRGVIVCERRPGRQTTFHLGNLVARVQRVSKEINKDRSVAEAANRARMRSRRVAS